MSRVRDIGELLAAGAGLLVGGALVAFLVFGGMFYRTACPSNVQWDFNPIPFVQTMDADIATGEATACSTDTATGYYTGQVPVIGDPVRALVKNFTGQAEPTPY
jgi:hypothetical protein